jgi:hypothetical protein
MAKLIFTRVALPILLLTSVQFASAGELPPGTVINAGNLSAMAEDTFEGHKIKDLMTPSLEVQIRDLALQVRLTNSTPLKIADAFWNATKKYASSVTYHPETNSIEGYVAGTPFPDVSEEDPYAAQKLIWNYFWWTSIFGQAVNGEYSTLLIDDEDGLEHEQVWHYAHFSMAGRTTGEPTLGDGLIQKKQAVVAKKPFDIAGLGLVTYRYVDGRMDDNWVYIKSIRRIRRVSGGSWMEPIGGTDTLYDDINGFNGHPSWYKGYKLIGKRYTLGYKVREANWYKNNGSPEKDYPTVDLKNWPHWNLIQKWEPVEVWEFEVEMPKEHPYGKKRYFMETKYLGLNPRWEAYDKKGDLWKAGVLGYGEVEDSDGNSWATRVVGQTIDLQRLHASVFLLDNLINVPGMGPDEVNKNMLIKIR